MIKNYHYAKWYINDGEEKKCTPTHYASSSTLPPPKKKAITVKPYTCPYCNTWSKVEGNYCPFCRKKKVEENV